MRGEPLKHKKGLLIGISVHLMKGCLHGWSFQSAIPWWLLLTCRIVGNSMIIGNTEDL